MAISRTRHRSLKGEMQPDAEHQEDHAQLGQLLDGFDIAHKTRCKRPDHDARQQISHDGGQAQPAGNQPAYKRQHQRQP